MIEARAERWGRPLLLEGRDWEVAARLPAVGGQQFRVAGVAREPTTSSSSRCSASTRCGTWPRRSSRSSPSSGTRSTRTPTRGRGRGARIPGRLEVMSPVAARSSSTGRTTRAARRRSRGRSPRPSPGTGCTWCSRCRRTRTSTASIGALAPIADVWYAAANDERPELPGRARRGADRRGGRPRRGPGNRGGGARGGPRRGRPRRPHPRDGLPLHCRGRPPGAGRIRLSHGQSKPTLLIVKPDGVRRRSDRRGAAPGRGGRARRSRTCGWRRSPRERAEEHYGEHRDKPFFGELVDFITGGPVVVAKVTGDDAIAVWRELMGPTDPADAPPGTIRGDLATGDHGEPRARQRLSGVGRPRAEALLRRVDRAMAGLQEAFDRVGAALEHHLMASHAAGAALGDHRPRGDPRRRGARDGGRGVGHPRPAGDALPDRLDLEVVRGDRRDAGGGRRPPRSRTSP